MSRGGDFSGDLAAISATVEQDVGAFMKLVREERTEHAGKPARRDESPNPSHDQQNGELDAQNAATANGPSKPRSKARPKSVPEEPVMLVNVTTRLRRETNELLTESALRQRLSKKAPSTRQDIVEEALQDWFRRQGYRRAGDSRA